MADLVLRAQRVMFGGELRPASVAVTNGGLQQLREQWAESS